LGLWSKPLRDRHDSDHCSQRQSDQSAGRPGYQHCPERSADPARRSSVAYSCLL